MKAVRQRRESIFGIAILAAGFAIASFYLAPLYSGTSMPQSLFPTVQQEMFFFDLFGLISGCWLLSWISAVNEWKAVAKVGQWLGIILLSVDETIMLGVWKDTLQAAGWMGSGIWIAPLLVQTYLAGIFLGFFTLPALTQSGNRTLTGLGTLVLILPWLLARTPIVTGVQFLEGKFFNP